MVPTGPKLQLSFDDALKLYEAMPFALEMFDTEEDAYEVLFNETLKKRVAKEMAAASGGVGRGGGSTNRSGGDGRRYKSALGGRI